MKIETPFQLISRLIGVRAIVAGPLDRSRCELVVDTAAVYTALFDEGRGATVGFRLRQP